MCQRHICTVTSNPVALLSKCATSVYSVLSCYVEPSITYVLRHLCGSDLSVWHVCNTRGTHVWIASKIGAATVGVHRCLTCECTSSQWISNPVVIPARWQDNTLDYWSSEHYHPCRQKIFFQNFTANANIFRKIFFSAFLRRGTGCDTQRVTATSVWDV